jgi:hypothetical protein
LNIFFTQLLALLLNFQITNGIFEHENKEGIVRVIS